MIPHVLVAEDREEVRSALIKAFEKAGCKVSAVQSGKSAFEIVKAGGVDLVISDIRMPDGTGIELLRWIRRLKKTSPVPPVIITTALLERGQDYLRKLGAS